MNQIPKTLPVLSHVLFPEKCGVLYLSTRYWSKCEVLISPQTHIIISVKIICAKQETEYEMQGVRCDEKNNINCHLLQNTVKSLKAKVFSSQSS